MDATPSGRAAKDGDRRPAGRFHRRGAPGGAGGGRRGASGRGAGGRSRRDEADRAQARRLRAHQPGDPQPQAAPAACRRGDRSGHRRRSRSTAPSAASPDAPDRARADGKRRCAEVGGRRRAGRGRRRPAGRRQDAARWWRRRRRPTPTSPSPRPAPSTAASAPATPRRRPPASPQRQPATAGNTPADQAAQPVVAGLGIRPAGAAGDRQRERTRRGDRLAQAGEGRGLRRSGGRLRGRRPLCRRRPRRQGSGQGGRMVPARRRRRRRRRPVPPRQPLRARPGRHQGPDQGGRLVSARRRPGQRQRHAQPRRPDERGRRRRSPTSRRRCNGSCAAANYGVRDSQYNLGVIYARGLGTPQDLVGLVQVVRDRRRPGRRRRRRSAATRWPSSCPATTSPRPAPRCRRGTPSRRSPTPTASARRRAAGTTPPAARSARPTAPRWSRRSRPCSPSRASTPGPADGVAGARTRDAVKAYQRENGIAADRPDRRHPGGGADRPAHLTTDGTRAHVRVPPSAAGCRRAHVDSRARRALYPPHIRAAGSSAHPTLPDPLSPC